MKETVKTNGQQPNVDKHRQYLSHVNTHYITCDELSNFFQNG